MYGIQRSKWSVHKLGGSEAVSLSTHAVLELLGLLSVQTATHLGEGEVHVGNSLVIPDGFASSGAVVGRVHGGCVIGVDARHFESDVLLDVFDLRIALRCDDVL